MDEIPILLYFVLVIIHIYIYSYIIIIIVNETPALTSKKEIARSPPRSAEQPYAPGRGRYIMLIYIYIYTYNMV